MISRSYDDQDSMIFVNGFGVWTLAEVDAHYKELRQMVDRLRSLGKPVRVLSDVRQATRQSPEVERRIAGHMTQTYRPEDRVAILTADAVDQTYVRERLGEAEIAVFSSQLAAEIWLLADVPRPEREVRSG